MTQSESSSSESGQARGEQVNSKCGDSRRKWETRLKDMIRRATASGGVDVEARE